MSNKVYQIVTDKIISMLENGTVPWQKPWVSGNAPKNYVSEHIYQGVNPWLLNCDAILKGYKSNYWLTYKQAESIGAHVKKGEHGSIVIYWNMIEVEDRDSSENETKNVPILRYFTVFNTEQCEGIKLPDKNNEPFIPIDEAESIINNMQNKPKIQHDGLTGAWYKPGLDLVNVPPKEQFTSPDSYYATSFHELVHSTGHSSRLDRKGVTKNHSFGSEDYSKEELIAEMGAAFLCAESGIEKTITNSAAYIKSWLSVLKDDNTMVIHAASAAQKAANYILGKNRESEK